MNIRKREALKNWKWISPCWNNQRSYQLLWKLKVFRVIKFQLCVDLQPDVHIRINCIFSNFVITSFFVGNELAFCVVLPIRILDLRLQSHRNFNLSNVDRLNVVVGSLSSGPVPWYRLPPRRRTHAILAQIWCTQLSLDKERHYVRLIESTPIVGPNFESKESSKCNWISRSSSLPNRLAFLVYPYICIVEKRVYLFAACKKLIKNLADREEGEGAWRRLRNLVGRCLVTKSYYIS